MIDPKANRITPCWRYGLRTWDHIDLFIISVESYRIFIDDEALDKLTGWITLEGERNYLLPLF